MPWNYEIARVVSYLDEIIIVIFFPLAMFYLYKSKDVKSPVCFILLFSFIILALSGIASGVVNGNAFITTAMGIFDYLKNFSVILIYFVFFRKLSEFESVFRLLLGLAVILGIVALSQELWAVGSVYMLGKDMADPGIYLFQKEVNISLLKDYWRFGAFRTSSLLISTISSGLYGLLIFNIYLFTSKKLSFAVVTALLTSILTSISRIVYVGFILVGGIQIFRKRRWLIIFLLPVTVLVFLMTGYRDLNVSELINKEESITIQDDETELSGNISLEGENGGQNLSDPSEFMEQHYRKYTRGKALEIWKDHPFLGVGPGMFGGVVSLTYDSYIYSLYDFQQKNFLEHLKSIDNFWLQLLAEMGIIGALSVIGLFIVLMSLFFILRGTVSQYKLKGLLTGLIVYEIVIFFYTIGLGLNVPAVFYTYCALAGIGLGCVDKREDCLD